MSKVILHIDLNTFFVRCEEIANPSLVGKPVAIGHLGRSGIISTCSYEARAYGVRSGMPTFKAVKLCPKLILIGGNYRLYEEMSNKFFNYLKRYSTIIEQTSVDEGFMDVSESIKKQKDPIAFFEKIRDDLYKETSLKCSIGVAPTKFLAKMASDMKKPMGITIIKRKDARKKLSPLPIEDFFGIGKKSAPRLKKLGINTIGDLAKRIDEDDIEIKEALGKFYYVIKEWVNGYGSDIVHTEPWDPKSVGVSHTTNYDLNDPEEIKLEIANTAREVSRRAKNAHKIGKRVQLVIKDSDFKVINRSSRLKRATNEYEDIIEKAMDLFDKNYDGRFVRLVGVTLQELVDKEKEVEQMSIFENYDIVKEKYATKLLIAELNRKMKKPLLITASEMLKDR